MPLTYKIFAGIIGIGGCIVGSRILYNPESVYLALMIIFGCVSAALIFYAIGAHLQNQENLISHEQQISIRLQMILDAQKRSTYPVPGMNIQTGYPPYAFTAPNVPQNTAAPNVPQNTAAPFDGRQNAEPPAGPQDNKQNTI